LTDFDKIDLLTCFEAEPEVGDDGISYRYATQRHGYRLILEFWPYDGDVHVVLYGPDQQLPLTEVWVHTCHAVRYSREGNVEELQFINRDYKAHGTAFKSLRLRVRPEFVVDITR
jgi:hypothetical protein